MTRPNDVKRHPPIETEWEAFRDEVGEQLGLLWRFLSYIDLRDDPPPLLFHHFAAQHTPQQCLRSLVLAALEHPKRQPV